MYNQFLHDSDIDLISVALLIDEVEGQFARVGGLELHHDTEKNTSKGIFGSSVDHLLLHRSTVRDPK